MLYSDPARKRSSNNKFQTYFTVGLILIIAIVFLAVFILIANDGVSTFLSLNDTPGSYSGVQGYLVGVNSTATGLDFVNPGSAGFQLVWYKYESDSGSASATTIADTFTIAGGANISTAIAVKTLTINLNIDSSVDFNGNDAINIDSLIGNATYVRVGTPATSNGVTGSNSLVVGGDLEVNGVTWLDGGLQVAGVTAFTNNVVVIGNIGLTGGIVATSTISAAAFDGATLWNLEDTNTGTNNASAGVNDVLTWNGTDWIPGTPSAGSQDLFNKVIADSGSKTVDSHTTTLIVAGGTDVQTSISGNTLTIAYTGIASGTTSLQDVTNVGNTTTNSITVNGLTSGGVIIAQDDVTINNNQPLEWEDSGGAQRRVLRLGAGDNVRLTNDAGGSIILETDDASGPGNLVTRLTFSGSVNEASATWNDIVHVGFELGSDMDGGGYDISNVATMSATAFEGSGYSLTGLTLWHLEDTNTGTDNATAADGQALVWDDANSWWEPGTVSGSTPNLQQVTDVGYVTTNPIESGTVTATDVIVPSWSLGSPTYSTLNDFFKLFNSAGRITGGEITQVGTTTQINVAAGTGLIRVADDDISQVKFMDWIASGTVVPNNTTYYVGVSCGTPSCTVEFRASEDWDFDTEFPLGVVSNFDGDIAFINNPWWISDGLTNVIERFQASGYNYRDGVVGGLEIGVTGTRNPTLSAGKVWSRLTEFDISAVDCSGTQMFVTMYRDGVGGWTRGGPLQQYPVTQYDDGSGVLQNIPDHSYANWWIYLNVDNDLNGYLVFVYPQDYYLSSGAASSASMPDNFPDTWDETGLYLGRIVFEQSVDEPVLVEAIFDDIDRNEFVLYDGSRDPDVLMSGGDDFIIEGGSFQVSGWELEYTGSSSPLSYGGTDYYTAGDIAAGYAIWDGAWSTTLFFDDGTTESLIDTLDETYGDLNAYAIDAMNDDSVLLTMYSNSGTDASIIQLISTFTGTTSAVIEQSWKPAFTKVGNTYSWTGTPSVAAPSVNTTWPDPPYLTASALPLFKVDGNSGTVTVAGSVDVSGHLRNRDNSSSRLYWSGPVSFGEQEINPTLPEEQSAVQVYKSFYSTSAGTINVALGFTGNLAPSSNSVSPLYGIFGGVFASDSNLAGVNFTGNMASSNYTLFADTSGQINNMFGNVTGLSMSEDGVTVDNFKGQTYSIYAGSSGTGTINNATIYDVAQLYAGNGWEVGNFYGLKIPDNSLYATTSWGIFNEDRSYFGRQLELGVNSYVQFEGDNDDNFETVLDVVEPTQDNTILLPNNSGTVALISDLSGTVSYEIVLTPGGGIVPATGGAEQAQTDGTNMSYYTLAFDHSSDETVFWEFIIPDTYTSGSITPTIYWVGTPVAGDVVWSVNTVGRTDSEQYDVALGGTQSVTTTIDGTTLDINTSTFTAFDPGWDAGDIVIWKLFRDANNGSDTMAGDADMIMAKIEWPANKE